MTSAAHLLIAFRSFVGCCLLCVSELKLPRYKYLVQVTIGENKGAGVRCGARCFWDQTTDKLAQTHYVNVSNKAQHIARPTAMAVHARCGSR